MSFREPPNAAALPPQRTRRREWLGLALVIAVPVGLLVAVAASISHFTNRDWDEANAAADHQLNEAITEADRLDPGWRLDELLARRKALSDEENSAVPVVAAKELLPTPWPSELDKDSMRAKGVSVPDAATIDSILWDLPPETQLNDEHLERLRLELHNASAALVDARKLADLPEGRHSFTLQPSYFGTLLSTQQDARPIAKLLRLDAVLLAQERKPDQALASIRAVINTGRSLGDEPALISQLIRLACRNEALTILERVLAQGEPSDAALAVMQQILAEEDGFPLTLIGARGERAGVHMLLENLEAGAVTTEQILPLLRALNSDLKLRDLEIATDPLALKAAHAWMLRWLNESVEIAKLAPWQRQPRLKQLEARTKVDAPPLARLLAPNVQKFFDADQRSQALLRCALVGMAVERYRRELGFWPRALADLEGKQLVKVPLDPYDGQPLRYRPPPLLGISQRPNDVVIYSIGPDGEDNGGKINRKEPNAPSIDIGFRLWNVSERRKPPSP